MANTILLRHALPPMLNWSTSGARSKSAPIAPLLIAERPAGSLNPRHRIRSNFRVLARVNGMLRAWES